MCKLAPSCQLSAQVASKAQTQIHPETLSKSTTAVRAPPAPTSALLHHVQETSQDLCLAPSESSGLNVTQAGWQTKVGRIKSGGGRKRKNLNNRNDSEMQDGRFLTCHTSGEQLVFILNEAPLGVFQAVRLKITWSHYIPKTSHQEERIVALTGFHICR